MLVNEIAPRPHNSGHYTIEACSCSQFEEHLRSILGMIPGNPDMIVNVSFDFFFKINSLLSTPLWSISLELVKDPKE